MSTFNDIQNALNTKLNSVSNIPTVYWPNTQNEPAQGTSWIRPTLMPATSELYTLNNENMHKGIYQIDIFTPLKKGSYDTIAIADSIRDAFNRASLVANTTTVFIQNISISSSQKVESWWHCYIEVNYLCVA